MRIQLKNISKACSYCNNLLDITEGDVLFDKKWYHKKCWKKNSLF
jgi:hypothetical protein